MLIFVSIMQLNFRKRLVIILSNHSNKNKVLKISSLALKVQSASYNHFLWVLIILHVVNVQMQDLPYRNKITQNSYGDSICINPRQNHWHLNENWSLLLMLKTKKRMKYHNVAEICNKLFKSLELSMIPKTP